MPAVQSVQTGAPPTEDLPAAQLVHVVAACSEDFPARHGTQVEAAAASTTAEYVPAAHSWQTVGAPPTEYLPAAQLAHVAAACSENFPARHGTQVEAAAASIAAENVPGPQSVQTEAPSTEYLPAVQLAHSVTELAPAFFENLPPAHVTQVEAAVAPTEA